MSRWQRNVLMLGAGGAILFGVASAHFPTAEPETRRLAFSLAFGLAAGTLCGVSRIVSAIIAVFAFSSLGLGACITLAEEINNGRLLAPPAALFVVAIVGVVLGTDESMPRRGSVLASAARRDLLTRVVVGILVVGGMTALLGNRSWAAGILAGAIIALAILIAIEVRLTQHIACWLSSAEPAPTSDFGEGETIDLGVGSEVRRLGPEALHPYRGAPPGQPRPLRLLGDPRIAARDLQSRTTMRALAMTVGAVALGLTLAGTDGQLTPKVAQAAQQLHPPLPRWDSPRRPVLLDVNGDGTEDVIGLRRVEIRSGDDSVDSYSLAAVSGVTLETLWATKPTPERPGAVVACSGQLFITSDDRAVAIIDPQSGTRRPIPAGEVRDLPGSPTCPLGDFCVDGDTRSCTPRPPMLDDLAKAGFGRAPLLRRHRDDGIALGSGRPAAAVGEGDGDFLFGFDPGTFKVRWREKVGDSGPPFGPTPRHHDVAFGRVLSHIPGSDGPLVAARDAKTGLELWRQPVPNAERGSGFYGFAASPTRVYVLAEGRIEILEAYTGRAIGTVR